VEEESQRSRAARRAAETALVRVVHHYGETPEFVVLGGLVPELLCAGSPYRHAGTTDVDVQVDLEIACGATKMRRLENALRNAEFVPDGERAWRWTTGDDPKAVVKFELLADLADEPAGATVHFDECEALGAANLRGTGFAARDVELCDLRARVRDARWSVQVKVTGLAGFLMAKTAAAAGRQKPKDWYDIAFVLLHHRAGGPLEAAERVRAIFGADIKGKVRVDLRALRANFEDVGTQGPRAYADQMLVDHPELDAAQLQADAVIAIQQFCDAVLA
jgi:hypothetical protein